MKLMVVTILASLFASPVFAETKTVTITNVHCKDCLGEVVERVCNKMHFEKCDVKQTDEKNELGELTVASKEKEKVDMVALAAALDKGGFPIAPEKKAPTKKK